MHWPAIHLGPWKTWGMVTIMVRAVAGRATGGCSGVSHSLGDELRQSSGPQARQCFSRQRRQQQHSALHTAQSATGADSEGLPSRSKLGLECFLLDNGLRV
ncbi:hypothetical protein K402DRAFT_201224 [Aulographum hederae CBS 113979]|uniref:Secreted protein n=1 Tax=Aulographum hederae CBS 113979 TaxID=1176131 RepID=A0A6G1HBS0_9PEZI|nr:hypothetical protein K402DRAFT_201224 [Aulographum hederae CBS 113979]